METSHDIIIETTEKLLRINQNEIIYLKSDGCYTEIYLKNGKKEVISKLLKIIENQIDSQVFYRCHKSYIINLCHFQELRKCNKSKCKELLLINDITVPIATRRYPAFRITIKNFFCSCH